MQCFHLVIPCTFGMLINFYLVEGYMQLPLLVSVNNLCYTEVGHFLAEQFFD